MISEVGGVQKPIKNHFFLTSIFALIFGRLFGRKIDQKWLQKLSGDIHFSLPKSTLAPKAIFGCILVVLWLPFGSLLLPLGSLLAPFGSLFAPFGSFLVHFWLPLAPFWLPFGFFALSFACFWLAFGSRLLSFAIPSSPFCYFRLRAYKFFKKTGFIRHPRPQSTRFFHFC